MDVTLDGTIRLRVAEAIARAFGYDPTELRDGIELPEPPPAPEPEPFEEPSDDEINAPPDEREAALVDDFLAEFERLVDEGEAA